MLLNLILLTLVSAQIWNNEYFNLLIEQFLGQSCNHGFIRMRRWNEEEVVSLQLNRRGRSENGTKNATHMGHHHHVLDNPRSNDHILGSTSDNHGPSHRKNISNPRGINDRFLNWNHSPNCPLLRPFHRSRGKESAQEPTWVHPLATHWSWFSTLSDFHGGRSTNRNKETKICSIAWFGG